MKISIIVPIYNIEKYIEKCINSITSQTYKNFELLLIDDGSTDDSSKICKKHICYNIKYYYKKNGGLSDARNYGIRRATGDYIMFVDGDDFLSDVDCLQSLNDRIMLNNSDVIQYKMNYFYESNNKIVEMKSLSYSGFSKDVYTNLDLLNRNGTLSVSACDKIVKSEIIKDNCIYFQKGLYSEDIDWSLRLYTYINSIDILDKPIYTYRQQREGSITTEKGNKRSEDLLYIIKKWYNIDYEDSLIKQIYFSYLAYQLLILITISDKKTFKKDDFVSIKDLYLELSKYDDVYKVRIFNNFSKIFGFSLSVKLMKLYLFLKNRGIIKI